MQSLAPLLDASAALHHHLCARQVLGVRMRLWAGQVLIPRAQARELARTFAPEARSRWEAQLQLVSTARAW